MERIRPLFKAPLVCEASSGMTMQRVPKLSCSVPLLAIPPTGQGKTYE